MGMKNATRCGRFHSLTCWKLWIARNDRIWNGKRTASRSLVEETKLYLAEWNNILGGEAENSNSRTTSLQKWELPSPGYLKLNTDAVVDTVRKQMGFGWVLRDAHGKFVAASSIPGKGVFTPKEAEAMAIREAMSWIKRNDLKFVQVECDALQVVQSLIHEEAVSSCDLVILDVKDMLRSLTHVAISHVNCTANNVAHRLAREACSLSVRQEWNSIPSSFIVNELYLDLN